ncbi:NAD(P)H-dependent oxidoreductase [Hymenobacter sp. BT175]|uniref:flavodoxin family protein n=1 Tax=Hymenobacter translucens TaxID=2886507 RepID=UPI001D0F4568|nr:NAD(P)H-dependent oxidoreductase [Hymenobacter translucens]MCC2547064.1 NAD(P)H-dependent oxidoreductase [Hymenobacter translucens]
MNATPLLLVGSARHESQAGDFARRLLAGTGYATINLFDLRIAPYDYQHAYPPDDQFAEVVDELLKHPVLVLATPVYWYAMSGPMKTLFDRLTDLTKTRKPAGRALRGKFVLLVATGSDEALPAGFTVPFERTAAYFGMQLQGSFYASTRVPAGPAGQETQRREFQELLRFNAGPALR